MFNKEKLFQSMESEGIEVLVCMSPESVIYLAGVSIHTQRSIPDRLAIVVWPIHDEPSFIVCNLEEAQAVEESWIQDVRAYVEFTTSPVKLLADTLQSRGLADRSVGVELGFLTAHYYMELVKLLPSAKLSDCHSVIDRLRLIKSPEEAAIMSRAAMLTDKVIAEVFGNIRAGKTESEIAADLQIRLIQEGADSKAFVTLAAGKNGILTHPVPGGYQASAGDLVRTDFGGIFHDYLSDIARTCVVETPSQAQKDTYRWLWEVHEQLIEHMTVGTPVCDIYSLCADLYGKAGEPFGRPHIGHSIGLSVHEFPMINPFTKQELLPGMILCIEPNVLIPGKEKYHVEDTILIENDGPRILSRSMDWSELLVVG